MKRILTISLAAGLAACSGSPEPSQPAPRAAAAPVDTMAAMLEAGRRVASVEFEPARVELVRGDSVMIRARLLDADGNAVEGARWGIQDAPGTDAESIKDRVPNAYMMRAVSPAEGAVRAFVALSSPSGEMAWRQLGELPVVVRDYPVARVEIDPPAYAAYAGTSFQLVGRPITTGGNEHANAEVAWTSDTPDIATITADGVATFRAPGRARFTASSEGQSARATLEVRENPVRRVHMDMPSGRVRTGDVVRLNVRPVDARGNRVEDLRVSYAATPTSGTGTAMIFDDGAFVAEDPGTYRVSATAGDAGAVTEITVAPREVRRESQFIGQGPAGTATSDLWVFEGLDGRDYAYTGTMQAATMFAWDVTDPASPVKTDSVTMDGRRINDVKINADRTIAIATSEGASNRQNGFTIYDIRDPAHPQRITHYTQDLTGGVHNVWIDGDIVYAVNDGTLDVHIIDISDPANPHEIGRWGLDKENKYLHDVSVWDGLAYLSYWDDGVVILDVGNGVKGGSPSNPQFVSSYKYSYQLGPETFANTHHVLPYTNRDGRRYIFAADEIFGCQECDNGPRGYVHVLDATDLENLEEVATYKLPDAGTHNMWVEDEKLYIAYYQGGLRIVDVSGELRGDLLEQGREIAHFDTDLEGGDNTTMAWGPQPYKGNVFVSDLNTGLWVVKVQPQTMTP